MKAGSQRKYIEDGNLGRRNPDSFWVHHHLGGTGVAEVASLETRSNWGAYEFYEDGLGILTDKALEPSGIGHFFQEAKNCFFGHGKRFGVGTDARIGRLVSWA